MYTPEELKKLINSMGIDNFIKWLLSNKDFSEETLDNFEDIHILVNGYPSICGIYKIAEVEI